MPQAKICNHCKRMVILEIKICPNCGNKEFTLVELSPSEE